MKYIQKTLDNGLSVIVVPMQDNPTVTISISAKTGSIFENKEISGLSHFLEHMCFKGTEKRPKSMDILEAFDQIGSENNAFTSHEWTTYYAKADKAHSKTIMEILSDIYLNSTIPESELEKERGVILQEYKMYQDDLRSLAGDVWMDLLYGDTTAGRKIIGNPETISNLKREDFLDYYKKQYVSNNTVVVIAGGITESEADNLVKEYLGDLKKGEEVIKRGKITENQNGPKVKVHKKDSDQTHLILGVRSFGVKDERNTAMRVMRAILSGGMSSRLFSKLREDLGICYYVYADNDTYTDYGNFAVYAGVDQNRLDIAIEAIQNELKRLKTEEVSEDELKKVKEGLIGRLNLSLESSDDIATFYLRRAVLGLPLKSKEEVIEEIAKVTPKEIKDLANSIFVNENLNLAVVDKKADEKELVKILKL